MEPYKFVCSVCAGESLSSIIFEMSGQGELTRSRVMHGRNCPGRSFDHHVSRVTL